MAAKRTTQEREEDRLFLLALMRTGLAGDPNYPVARAVEALNRHRARVARERAEILGLSDEEIEEAVEASRLTYSAINRDYNICLERVRQGGVALAAALLDDQVAQVSLAIERSYLRILEIKQDRRRSRDQQQVEEGPDGYRRITPVTDGPAAASYYTAEQREEKLQADLRSELRKLVISRTMLPDNLDDNPETFSGLVTDLADPGKALEAARELYTGAIQQAVRTHAVPLGPADADVARQVRELQRRRKEEAEMLRTFMTHAAAASGRRQFEIRLTEEPPPAPGVPEDTP